MKRLALPFITALALAAGCTPNVDKSPPPTQVHARFDPSTSPPTVPSPNSLAIDPATGKVVLPLGPDATDADRELAAYFATLDGFPASTPAQATFDGELNADSVTAQNVRVIDLTAGLQPVTNAALSISPAPPGAGSALQITLPGGWQAGHDYAAVLVGGENGLKGTDGKPVVGTSVWALTRSQASLVTCSELTSSDCRSTTGLLSDQQAIQLEPLRRLYQPLFDALAATGLSRENIPLLWTFKIASATVMAFQPSASPPVVPTPTDLALDPNTGTLNIPVDPTTSPANQAFVRDYLNTLNGFPVSTQGSAPAAGGKLQAGSVSATTVRVIDLTPPADGGAPGGAVDATVGYDDTANALTLQPPSGGWLKGHHYAVLVVGGPTGVKSSSGDPVSASDVWILARGQAPVATCADPNDPGCTSNLTVVNLADSDAARLEQLRQALAPLLDAAAAQGLPREAIPVAWTFGIFSNPEAVFDPANAVIPFPNDLLRSTPADGGAAHVALPVPDGGSPQVQQLIAGLNTLDGFSTTAPVISENSPMRAPLSDGARIDPASLEAATGFVLLQPSGAPDVLQTSPHVIACVSCASSLLADGGTQVGGGAPEQLQFIPQVPLDEQTTYAAFVSTGLKSQGGPNVVATPTFALIRSPEPLVDQNGKSTVEGVSDAQAKALEPARQGLQPVFDALDAMGHPRQQLALAWAFTTQSTVSQLAQLGGLPAAAPLLDTPLALAPDPIAVPGPNESAVFSGEMASLFVLTGPGGTLNPGGAMPERLPFVLVLPKTAPPSNGYPVAIYAHGLGGNRNTALRLADSLAQAGFATIAIDNVWHGDRTSCTGSAAALQAAGIAGATDDFACGGPGATPNPVTQTCDEKTPIGRCVSRAAPGKTCTFLSPSAATDGSGGDLYCASIDEGHCKATSDGSPGPSRCEGGDFWRPAAGAAPVISGWNIFDTTNLFATRDNLRQQVVDLAQLARVVKGSGANSLNDLLGKAGASGTLDGTQIHFVGQSLGSIFGSLYNAVSPDTHRVVLNAPAGDLPRILLTTQDENLGAARDAFLAGLAAQGIPQGTPGFDDFIGFARWILDPSDPVNAGASLAQGSFIPADRQTFFQFIEGDQTLSNATTEELIAATVRPEQMTCADGGAPPCADVFEFTQQQFGADLPADSSRHGFLTNGASPTVTTDAQNQIVQYLTQGSVKTTFP